MKVGQCGNEACKGILWQDDSGSPALCDRCQEAEAAKPKKGK